MPTGRKFFWTPDVMTDAQPASYWLEQVRTRYNLGSDAKVAAMLKISKPAVSQLMTGKTQMSIKTAITIGGLLDVDPLLILSSVMSLIEGDSQEFWQHTFEERLGKQ